MKAKILVSAVLAIAMLIPGGLFMSANASVRAVAGITAAGPSGGSPATTGQVLIAVAGMLDDLVRTGLTPALAPQGIAITSEPGMSLSVSRSIRDDLLPADLYGSADANANQLLTGDANSNKVRWFAAFARDSIVLAYSPNSQYLAEFDKAQRGEEPWYEPLEEPGVTVARSNPDNDPSGYYALFVA